MKRSTRAALAAASLICAASCCAAPETVTFMSRDGKTQLTGYLFGPQTPGRHPAVVMLHGRAGPYSSLKRGTYTSETLTMRHRMWGEFWAQQGYVALHVDSFGPRGYPAFVLYPGAHHAYDDPGKSKQSHAPNREALADTRRRATEFFQQHLQRGNP